MSADPLPGAAERQPETPFFREIDTLLTQMSGTGVSGGAPRGEIWYLGVTAANLPEFMRRAQAAGCTVAYDAATRVCAVSRGGETVRLRPAPPTPGRAERIRELDGHRVIVRYPLVTLENRRIDVGQAYALRALPDGRCMLSDAAGQRFELAADQIENVFRVGETAYDAYNDRVGVVSMGAGRQPVLRVSATQAGELRGATYPLTAEQRDALAAFRDQPAIARVGEIRTLRGEEFDENTQFDSFDALDIDFDDDADDVVDGPSAPPQPNPEGLGPWHTVPAGRYDLRVRDGRLTLEGPRGTYEIGVRQLPKLIRPAS